MSSTLDDGQLMEGVTDALLVLSNVRYGDFDTRVSVKLPDDSPLGALLSGINEMIDALKTERDQNHAYQAQLEEKLAMIEQQRAAIRELSAPIMEVWQGVLCLPIVGVMDTVRSAETTDSLLHAVAQKQAKCTIVDITGIEVMDTRTVDHFIKMARAVRLLGAHCMLTGVSPSIADTVVQMGLDLRGIETHRTLREALTAYVAQRARDSASGGGQGAR
jgi:rsbT co-antagonist protein RsbR